MDGNYLKGQSVVVRHIHGDINKPADICISERRDGTEDACVYGIDVRAITRKSNRIVSNNCGNRYERPWNY